MREDLANRDADSLIRTRGMLTRIASALGLPDEAFLERTGVNSELEDACELLELWHSLGSAADRRELLALARTLARRS